MEYLVIFITVPSTSHSKCDAGNSALAEQAGSEPSCARSLSCPGRLPPPPVCFMGTARVGVAHPLLTEVRCSLRPVPLCRSCSSAKEATTPGSPRPPGQPRQPQQPRRQLQRGRQGGHGVGLRARLCGVLPVSAEGLLRVGRRLLGVVPRP